MAKKLPGVDAFTAMLERGFPNGPLADAVVTAEPISARVQPVPVESSEPAKANNAKPVRGKRGFDALTEQVFDEPASQPANDQAKEAANHLANEPVKQQANEPDNKPVSEPAKPTNDQAKEASHPAYPAKEPAKQEANEPDNEPVNRPDIKPAKEPVSEAVKHQANDPAYLNSTPIDPELWYPYTEKQGRILLYLINAGGRTKRENIANDTGISLATVKYSLRVFVKDGYISPTVLDVNHTVRGFSYNINYQRCNEYTARIYGRGLSEPAKHPANEPVHWPDHRPVIKPVHGPVGYPVHEPVNGSVAPFSSSKDLKLTTTTKTEAESETAENPTADKAGILNEPELRFWAAEGVTEKQVRKWMDEFQMTEDEMKVSLRYARFDILERNDVQNASNWFYKIVARNSFYPCPPNYRSPLELRAEAVKQQQERDSEAKKQVEQAGFESSFQAFLADPDTPLYQELFAQISSFSKEQFKAGERMEAEIELKELFRQKTEIG